MPRTDWWRPDEGPRPYVKTSEVFERITGGAAAPTFQGTVQTVADLPETANVGDLYYVRQDSGLYYARGDDGAPDS